MINFQEQDGEFRKWCEQYSNGFYLTQKSHSKFVLHKADCHHAGSLSIGSSPTKHAKYCSLDREELVRWGSSEGREIVKICGSCLNPREPSLTFALQLRPNPVRE